jgi:transposase-like protein
MKRKVIAIKGRSKQEVEAAMRVAEEMDSRVELIQSLIPVGLDAVGELLKQEVRMLAGDRYQRGRLLPGLVRWGRQRSSIYLADQKIPVMAPRVRDQIANREIPLKSLEGLQTPRSMDAGLFSKVLKGLSCRDYLECAEAVPQAFGLSPSTVSRRYIRASAKKLEEFLNRRLDGYEFVVLILDGKRFAEDEMVMAVGITVEGEKVILGFVQTATENEKACSDFLRELVGRGLRYNDGILAIIDGSKGLKKAVESVLGDKAVIQRCQWHKRENVVAYLSKEKQGSMRRRLQAAYEQTTYDEAKGALLKLKSELKLMNLSAAKSLEEGFEESLTLHRLGLFAELGTSLKTTNLIESINAGLGQRTDKVDYWRSSDQKQRWVASSLLEQEKRLRRIKGYRHLPRLKDALKKMLDEKESYKMRKAA